MGTSAYGRKEESFDVNEKSAYLHKLDQEKQNICEARQKEIIKKRAEINSIKIRKTVTIESKSWFFKMINEMSKSESIMINKLRKEEQITNTGNETRDIRSHGQ